MNISVLKITILTAAMGGMIFSLSSCAGGKTQNYSAEGVAFGPDGKPVSFDGDVPVATRSNQFSPGGNASAGGGGGGH